jgi:DNA-binding HxlR family transcriptional regulator
MITYEHNWNREVVLHDLWDKEVIYLLDRQIRQMAFQQFKRDLKTHTTEELSQHLKGLMD